MWNVFYFCKNLVEKKPLVPMWALLNVSYYCVKGVQAINDNLCDSLVTRSCKLLHVFWFKFGQERMDLSVVWYKDLQVKKL
jgi:hypothetical protein